MLNYYGKFIPNLLTIVQPLNNLLRRETKWEWSEQCKDALESAKQALASSNVLYLNLYDSWQGTHMQGASLT